MTLMPGIGKTSAATIMAKMLGFEVKEVNASDTRGKSGNDVREGIDGKASNAIREMVTNRSMVFANAGGAGCMLLTLTTSSTTC